jgi:hypothetical protein
MTDNLRPFGLKMERWLRGALLFRIPNSRLDSFATVATALLVFVSRFAYLANGPWEWDETLFARGILHFELAAHFPHPPGFPGWLAIGHCLTPVVGDPLLALQIASATFSVAALWVLAALGRRVASPAVAAAAALVVLAAPGPWLYSVRGFSSTAASVLALGAAAVAAGGLRGRRLTFFTLLVTASFLVRPNLLPVLGVLWFGVVWSERPLRRLVPGVVVGAAAVAVSVTLMARAEGGWGAFVAPFLVHSQRHFSRLAGNLGGYADLGLIKGLGGALPATMILLAALIGVTVWARRIGRKGAVLWLSVLVIAAAQLVWMQNRTTGRYAVGVQMALAPLVAGAASLVPPAAGCTGLLLVAGWFGVGSQPLLEEQHETELPAWRAVNWARKDALRSERTVVLEPELHPFASYLWHVLEWRGEPTPPKVLSPWDPEPWNGVNGAWLVATVHRHLYPDALLGRERYWSGVSVQLHPLTQQRFLEAWVIEDPPLPLAGWWPREQGQDGRTFMWGGPRAELLLPPMATGSKIGVALRPAPGADPVAVLLDEATVATIDGGAGERRLWFEIQPGTSGRSTQLKFDRARGFPPSRGDSRPLAVQVFEMRTLSPVDGWAGPVVHSWQREALQIEVEGASDAESFPGVDDGVWLAPRAVVRIPAGRGSLRLRLWAPRPTPPETVIWIAGQPVAGPLDIGPRAQEFDVQIPETGSWGDRLEIVIASDPYRPADDGSADRRELGVVLSHLEFMPRGQGS